MKEKEKKEAKKKEAEERASTSFASLNKAPKKAVKLTIQELHRLPSPGECIHVWVHMQIMVCSCINCNFP